jgi:broad specificity phosphatase PhoE
MKMPIITFIRHAETVYNDNKIFAGRIDCELSKKGIQDTIRKFDYKKDDISQELVLNYRDGLYTPPNAETMQEVDYRVAGFVSELFESYDDDTKILAITHNGVMRSIKRNFLPNYKNIMSNNLDSIILDKSNYNYYLNNKKQKS